MLLNETSAHAFFFDSAADAVPSYYGGVFDPAFLKALSSADSTGSVCSRVLRGDASIEAICVRVTNVSQTVIWDLADAFVHQWHTVDLESFPLRLPGNRVHCIVLTTFPGVLREEIDRHLQGSLGYLGAAELDLGNPVQVAIFISHLIDSAFISDGVVYLERSWEGIDDTVFEGASSFKPGGERRLLREEFDEQKPPLASVSLSERGRVSAERYDGKRIFTIEERVINSLATFRDADKNPFAFTATADPESILEADVPEAKFIRYLLDPQHPKGGGKAKFFREVLSIGPDDWRYLAAQFYDGLLRTEFSDLKIKTWQDKKTGEDGLGASFNCVLPIRGLNGRVARVLTNWVLKPGQQPQFSTAFPAEKDSALLSPEQPGIVSGKLPDQERWKELYRLADKAGNRAAQVSVPTPMKVEGCAIEMDGLCGSASINIPDARRGFARWVIRSKVGSRHYKGGAQIFTYHPSQSIDRAVAYAKAFAVTLKLNGIDCTVESFLD